MSTITKENPNTWRVKARQQENAYFNLREAGLNHRQACMELGVTRYRAEELSQAYSYSRRKLEEVVVPAAANLDAAYVRACLDQGGFTRGVMLHGQMVQVRP